MSDAAVADNQPRYNPQTRERIALAKWYGMSGSDEEWAVSDIADHLNVTERTVERYLYESEMAEDVERMLAQRQATTRMEILERMHERLEELDAVEDEVAKAAEIVPNEFEIQEGSVKIDPSDIPGFDAPEGVETVELMDVPVPSGYTEIPDVDELSDVWREQRHTEGQITDVLGLEQSEEVESRAEQNVEVKHWSVEDQLPEQEVVNVDE